MAAKGRRSEEGAKYEEQGAANAHDEEEGSESNFSFGEEVQERAAPMDKEEDAESCEALHKPCA